MIYYQYKTNYTAIDQPAEIRITRAIEDALYTTHLEETKRIARRQMRQNNAGSLPSFTESIVTLTLSQYNVIVKGPDDLIADAEIEPQIQDE